jgi:hypothetical protein
MIFDRQKSEKEDIPKEISPKELEKRAKEIKMV